MSNNILLTSSQAAQALGMSVSSLCRLDALGAPVSYTPGGHRRWDIDELREWVHQQRLACERDCEEEDDPDDEDEDLELEEDEGDDPDESSDEGEPLDDESSDEGDPLEDEDECPTCGAELEDDDSEDDEEE